MSGSKPRFSVRPLVERLESRLQPGSVITGAGYGWSLLADKLSILDQGAGDSHVVVSQSSSERSNPAAAGTPLDVQSNNLSIAAASVTTARNQPATLPATNLVQNVAASLDDELSSFAPAAPSHSILLATAAMPSLQQPPPATPLGSVPQSPTGVATPAQPLVSSVVNSPSLATVGKPVNAADSGHHALPAKAAPLDNLTVHSFAGLHTASDLHAVPISLNHLINSAAGSNQASINFLTYVGEGVGPDSINSIVVSNEGGTNFLYIAGSLTDSSTGMTLPFASKATDGATSVVWVDELFGPDGPSTGTATDLEVNGNGVYVTGNFADSTPTVTLGTDGFVMQLDPNTGNQIGPGAELTNGTLAAVTSDLTSGNVYVAGSAHEMSATDPNERAITFAKLSSDLQSKIYAASAARSLDNVNPANSAITTGGGVSFGGIAGTRSTGGGLIVDALGNVYFAGTAGTVGDPNNETFAIYGRLNASGSALDWGFFVSNVTHGPGGMGTALAFDPSAGDVVFTGSLNDNTGTPLNQDLLLGRADLATGNILDAGGEPFVWFVDDRTAAANRVGDWTGNNLLVLPDGSSIVTGAAFDLAAGAGNPTSVPTNGIDVHITHFTADDQSTTQNPDGDPEGIFGGSGTDIGNAIAVDPSGGTSPFHVYVVGSTSSTDLPTTPGVVVPSYSGTNATGFLGLASVA
jgi:hypothetical protein